MLTMVKCWTVLVVYSLLRGVWADPSYNSTENSDNCLLTWSLRCFQRKGLDLLTTLDQLPEWKITRFLTVVKKAEANNTVSQGRSESSSPTDSLQSYLDTHLLRLYLPTSLSSSSQQRSFDFSLSLPQVTEVAEARKGNINLAQLSKLKKGGGKKGGGGKIGMIMGIGGLIGSLLGKVVGMIAIKALVISTAALTMAKMLLMGKMMKGGGGKGGGGILAKLTSLKGGGTMMMPMTMYGVGTGNSGWSSGGSWDTGSSYQPMDMAYSGGYGAESG